MKRFWQCRDAFEVMWTRLRRREHVGSIRDVFEASVTRLG